MSAAATRNTPLPAPRSALLPVALLTLTLLLAGVLSIALGAAGLPLASVLDALTGGGDAATRAIVLELRLPRAALAALVGAALALSGAAFQALLRNPLADPYILGVSGGAAVGAVATVTLGGAARATWLLPVAALAGALLAIALVFRIALAVGRALDTRVLLLAGVMVGAFSSAILLLLVTLADAESFRSAVFWLMGSLAPASWQTAAAMAAYLLPASIALYVLARPLDLLAVGEETAQTLGVRSERVKRAVYFLASLLTAVAVASCGVIGFVGLIVPHGVRLLWGGNHRALLPLSLLGGATFLLVADTAARTIAAPTELPIGVITALVGAPLFVVLLVRRTR